MLHPLFSLSESDIRSTGCLLAFRVNFLECTDFLELPHSYAGFLLFFSHLLSGHVECEWSITDCLWSRSCFSFLQLDSLELSSLPWKMLA